MHSFLRPSFIKQTYSRLSVGPPPSSYLKQRGLGTKLESESHISLTHFHSPFSFATLGLRSFTFTSYLQAISCGRAHRADSLIFVTRTFHANQRTRIRANPCFCLLVSGFALWIFACRCAWRILFVLCVATELDHGHVGGLGGKFHLRETGREARIT